MLRAPSALGGRLRPVLHKVGQVVEAVEVDFVAVGGGLRVGQLEEPVGYLTSVLQVRLNIIAGLRDN